MATIKAQSLFTKILGIVMGIFFVSALVVFVLVGGTLQSRLMHEYETKADAISRSIADSSVDVLLNRDPATLQALINLFQEIEGVAYVMVRDSSGDVLAHTFVPGVPESISVVQMGYFSSGKPSEGGEGFLSVPGIGKVYEVASPILSGEIGIVHVGMALGLIRAAIIKACLFVGLCFFVIFLISVWVMRWFMGTVSQPLLRLSSYAQSLGDSSFETPLSDQGEIQLLSLHLNDEVGGLAGSIVGMENQLITHIQDLKSTMLQKNKLESELLIGQEIQMSMLPKPAEMAAFTEFGLDAYLSPAKEVSGDFYDFFVRNDHLYMVVGDVSGKGVFAALFMAMTMTLIKSASAGSQNPSDIIARVNRQLEARNDNMLFVTVFMGVMNLRTGEMKFVNGGHPGPFVRSKSGEVSQLPLTNGMALGLNPNFYFQSGTYVMKTGDQLFVYTDGISEAMNMARDLYGEERIEAFLSKHDFGGPRDMLAMVRGDVGNFVGGAEQSDDITLLCVEWKADTMDIGTELGVHFNNEIAEIEKLHQVLKMFGSANSIPEEILMNVNLVLEELLVNVISYGYDDHEVHQIEAIMNLENGVLHMTLKDDGKAFNPLEAPEVDMSVSLEDMSVGGLGIHLVKSLMDEVHYAREGEYNVVKLTKNLEAQDGN